jgi:O-antigen ligase
VSAAQTQTHWLACFLALWAVGAQLNEAVALLGAIGAAVALGWALLPRRRSEARLPEEGPLTGPRLMERRGDARPEPGGRSALLGWSPAAPDRRWTATALGLLAAFVGWSATGSLLEGHAPSGTGLARLAHWLLLPVAALGVAQVEPHRRRWIAWAAGVTLVLSSLVAGLQHFGIWPGPELTAQLPERWVPFYRVYEPAPGTEGRFMAGGLLFHRLKFAHVGGLAVLAMLSVGQLTRGRTRTLAWLAAAIGVVAIVLFPVARAATAALLGACAVWGLLTIRRRAVALGAIVMLGLATALVVGLNAPLRARFTSSLTGEGGGERAALWRTGVAALRQAPVGGVGAGRFRAKDLARPEDPQPVREHTGKAHNQLLSIGAESGAVGAALFLAAIVSLAVAYRRMGQRGTLGLTSLAYFALLSPVHDPLFHPEFSLALMLCLGAAPGLSERFGATASATPPGPRLADEVPLSAPAPALGDTPPTSASRTRPR